MIARLLRPRLGLAQFYSRTEARRVDTMVRRAISAIGSPSSRGNGAEPELVTRSVPDPGVLLVHELRERYPGISITESHPKAVLYLESAARRMSAPTEHERDALIGTLSAWPAASNPEGWTDLARLEPNQVRPFPGPVSYWMPNLEAVDRHVPAVL